MSKEIQLTQNKVAIVDDEDFEWLTRYKWYAYKSPVTWYAARTERHNGNHISVRMHREIMDLAKGDTREIDHKDHDGLNNHRGNLRIATTAQNQHNGRKKKGTSRYKGVCWHQQCVKWQAQIRVNNRHIHLGVFISETEAALAYDVAARTYFGEFACLNKVGE